MLTSLFASLLLFAQTTFIPPMTHEISLAGNFGEPRPNHFHGGLDLRTEGVEGKAVRAIGDGYVSRITVSMSGYGNAVYVTHPEGYTSIYGHLQRFSPRLESLLKKWQYEHEQYEADVRLTAVDCPVSKGQLIAFSGNTGYSFGPHLHLEVRETATWSMLDPLEFLGPYVNDSVAPKLHGIRVYPQRGRGVYCHSAEVQELKDDGTAWGDIGIGIYADDYMQNSSNHYGIRLTQLFVDGREVFRADVNGVPPSCNRMVNSWGDYDYYYRHSTWYLKSFIEPGNTLPILQGDVNRGIIHIGEERDYQLEYVLTDYFGNTLHHKFTIKGQQSEIPLPPNISGTWLRWDQTNVVSLPGMQLVVPKGFLATDVAIQPSVPERQQSQTYQFTKQSCPLLYDAELSIAVRGLVNDSSKWFIVCHYGKDLFLEGTFHNGWVTSRVRDLGGTYELMYDDTPPEVIARHTTGNDNGTIRLELKDLQSGVKSYKGYVDGQFILFQPQPKSSLITCRLSDTPLRRNGQQRRLRVVVDDNCNNRQTYETTIKY